MQAQNWNIILILGLQNAKLTYKGTENVANYAFSSGKYQDVMLV